MARASDNEVRLLSNLIMRMSPGALLGDLDKQHKVFKDYWQMADANSFRAENKSFSLPEPLAGQRDFWRAVLDCTPHG